MRFRPFVAAELTIAGLLIPETMSVECGGNDMPAAMEPLDAPPPAFVSNVLMALRTSYFVLNTTSRM